MLDNDDAASNPIYLSTVVQLGILYVGSVVGGTAVGSSEARSQGRRLWNSVRIPIIEID